MVTTPLMLLVLPNDHGSIDTWDTVLDTVFGLIDGHDHTTGKGAKIKMSAVTVDGDVSWSASGVSRAITDLRAIDFSPVAASSMTGLSGAFFVNASDNNELYFRTSGGTNIKITAGNSLNVVQFTGGIGGDYSAVSALLSYDDATRSYWLQQEGSPRPWAVLRTGDVQIFQSAASITQAVTLRSPSALATGYALVLPTSLPSTQKAFVVDATGNCLLGKGFTLDTNESITISGSATYKHGSKTITKVVGSGDLLSTSGSVGSTAGVPGVTIGSGASGATAIVRLPDLPDYVTMSQVTFGCASASDASIVASGSSVLVIATTSSYLSLGSGALFHPSGSNAVAAATGNQIMAQLITSSQARVVTVSVTYSV